MATNQIHKAVRLPKELIERIEKAAKAEGSTLSQFLRTAAINELKRRRAA